MHTSLDIAFFGSSLVSAYWNGAATYYRGIIRELTARGHRVTFFEPDAFERQKHRDMEDPDWAEVVVYPAYDYRNQEITEGVYAALRHARDADVIIKASGVGVFDALLEQEVLQLKRDTNQVIFWDVDAPATLSHVESDQDDALRDLIPLFDMVLTYGGGEPVVQHYRHLGAKHCQPIYNAFDPDVHHPVVPDDRFVADLSFLGNRLPDREARVDDFFFNAAAALPDRRFLLGGSGWKDKDLPHNVKWTGHVYTANHNAFNCSALAVLNISRDSMASYGFSPATRVFEAAGAGACLITDDWEGVDLFFDPGAEILTAKSGSDVADQLEGLSLNRANAIGEAARRRALSDHTYAHRVDELEDALQLTRVKRRAAAG